MPAGTAGQALLFRLAQGWCVQFVANLCGPIYARPAVGMISDDSHPVCRYKMGAVPNDQLFVCVQYDYMINDKRGLLRSKTISAKWAPPPILVETVRVHADPVIPKTYSAHHLPTIRGRRAPIPRLPHIETRQLGRRVASHFTGHGPVTWTLDVQHYGRRVAGTVFFDHILTHRRVRQQPHLASAAINRPARQCAQR